MAGTTFASRSYRDAALVLRTHDLGEADRIITVLTPGHGLVRAVARGVRRTTSKFGATLEPFMAADVQFVHGRNLDIVTQAVSKGSYGAAIVADYDKYLAAHTMAQAAERLSETDVDDSREQFRLLHGAVSALARGVHPPDAVQSSYLLRALARAGWAVSWQGCVACGRRGEQQGFSAALGGPVCQDCRPPGAMRLEHGTMVLLRALQAGDWEQARAATRVQRHEAAAVVHGYAQHQLERRLGVG